MQILFAPFYDKMINQASQLLYKFDDVVVDVVVVVVVLHNLTHLATMISG